MSKAQANLLLMAAAALWGLGNVAQKSVLEDLDPFSAVGLRCLIGGLLILPLMRLDREGLLASGYWPSATRVAAIFALALLMEQAAYLSKTVTNASCLVNTATVMTPLLAWVVLRERASLQVWGVAGITMIGVFLLCGGMQAFGTGDIVALISALFYAAWMIELGRHMQTFGHPVRTASTQFLVTAVIALQSAGSGEHFRQVRPSLPFRSFCCWVSGRPRSPSVSKPSLSVIRWPPTSQSS